MKRSHTAIAIVSDPKSEFDVVDAGRAAQNMTLVGWELGIGSVFISGPEPPERVAYRKRAKQLLGVPEHLNLVDLIVLGYPKRRRMVTRKRRKELKDIVFEGRFGHPTTLNTDAASRRQQSVALFSLLGLAAQLDDGVVIGCTSRLRFGWYTVPSMWS